MLPIITGWANYYKLADMKKLLMSTDEWMRRHIRMVFWKKWKRVRTKYRNPALSSKRLEKAGFLSF